MPYSGRGCTLGIVASSCLLTMLLAGGCVTEMTPPAQAALEQGLFQRLDEERPLSGTLYEIHLWTTDPLGARNAMDSAFQEIARCELLLSEWTESGEVSAINRGAGQFPVAVSPELLGVVARSMHFSELTGGAFDITWATCGNLWSIRERRIPDESSLSACLQHLGYRQVLVDVERSTLFLRDPQTRIGLGAIGKGYRVDRAADILQGAGITDFIVKGGGDMRVEGKDGEQPWTIQIQHPRRQDAILGSFAVDRAAVSSSGDYSWYFEKDGVRYHHIIDPRTGRPATRSIAVTVIARNGNAIDSDALSTGLFVLGPEKGLGLVSTLQGVEAMIIGPDLVVHASKQFPALSGVEAVASVSGTAGTGVSLLP